MSRTAKRFQRGRKQAVLLPSEFRFEGSGGFIRKDHITGKVILSQRRDSWESFFELVDKTDVPEDFMRDRGDRPPQKRRRF